MFMMTQLAGFGASSSAIADGINRLPSMTGPTTSGVTVSCTNESGFGYNSWKAADRSNSTDFLTNNGNTAAVWKVDFGAGNSYVIQSYSMTELTPAEYVSGSRYPANWTFQGSSDDTNWTTLDTQSGQSSFAANAKRTFNISNQTAYRYYRFNVQANGPGNVFGWAECELMT